MRLRLNGGQIANPEWKLVFQKYAVDFWVHRGIPAIACEPTQI